MHRTTERVHLRLDAGAFVQGYGWSGLLPTNATIGATIQLGSTNVNADVRFPLSQRTLTDGDTFKQGPTFVITVGGLLRQP